MMKGKRMCPCLSASALLLLAVCSLTTCRMKSGSDVRTGQRAQPSPAAVEQATPSDGVRRVTVAELQDALEKGTAVAVDVRGGVEYRLGHILGARSIPLGLIASEAGGLPQDKLIVTYCA